MKHQNLFRSKSGRGIDPSNEEMNKELRLAKFHQLRYGKLLKQQLLIMSSVLFKLISEDEKSIKKEMRKQVK
jgi:hypothetical protein